MIPPHNSLVKYDNPILVSTTKDKSKKSAKKKAALPPVEQRQQPTQTEDILNSILPPCEWTEDGQLRVLNGSSTQRAFLSGCVAQSLRASRGPHSRFRFCPRRRRRPIARPTATPAGYRGTPPP